MFLITKNGEIKIKVDSEILVKGAPVFYGKSKAVEINGYTVKNISGSVAIIPKNGNGDRASIIGKIVRFQGIRPVVQFGEGDEITLNNPKEDILKVIQT